MPTPDLVAAFEALLARRGAALDRLDLAAALDALCDLHAHHRPPDLADWGGEEDMLIVEWGSAHGAPGRTEVLLVRQLIAPGGAIGQLQLRLFFEGAGIEPGSTDWQLDPGGLRRAAARLVDALSGRAPTARALVFDRM